MYEWILSGTGLDPASALDAVFEADHQDPVVLSNITFYSLCEHHLLPFFGTARVAYIPNGTISGISKLARVLEVASRRLQVQERLTGQVADAIFSALDPHGVVVELQAEHMCMSMRGIQNPGNRVVTTAIRGRFENKGLGEKGLLALLHREVD